MQWTVHCNLKACRMCWGRQQQHQQQQADAHTGDQHCNSHLLRMVTATSRTKWAIVAIKDVICVLYLAHAIPYSRIEPLLVCKSDFNLQLCSSFATYHYRPFVQNNPDYPCGPFQSDIIDYFLKATKLLQTKVEISK